MNYETEIAPLLAQGNTPAEIADEINEERRLNPANYRPLTPKGITRYLATNGLSVRITEWIETEKAKSSEQRIAAYEVLAAAFNGLLASQSGNDHSMETAPGTDDRTLIETAIELGVMQSSDLATLDTLAYAGKDESAETVQAAINVHESPPSRWSRAVTSAARIVEAGNASSEGVVAALEAAVTAAEGE